MKAINKLRKRTAISPVIATVILVAVAITVSVAVSYWMGSIASQYTSFEKVEIQTAICTWDGDDGDPMTTDTFDWIIEIKLKNSGTATATLSNIFINDVEVDTYGVGTTAPGDGEATTDMTETETIESGVTKTITVFIDGLGDTIEAGVPTDAQWQKVSSGTTINIKIHSAGGMDYIKLLRLT